MSSEEERQAEIAAVVKSCQAATQREAYARREQTQAMRDYVQWLLAREQETGEVTQVAGTSE